VVSWENQQSIHFFDEKVNLRFRKAAERAFYCFTGFSGTITKAAGSGQRQRPDE